MTILDELARLVEERLRLVVREELRAALPASASPPSPGLPAYVDAAQAAELAGVQPATIRNWVAVGKIRGYRAGRLLRVRVDELERFLADPERRGPSAVDVEERKRRALAKLK